MRFAWLRSVVGEREKWSGERREAPSETQPERNAAADRRRKPAAIAAHCQCPLVTSAFFAKRNRCSRRGNGTTGKPVKRSKNCVGHGGTFSECLAQVHQNNIVKLRCPVKQTVIGSDAGQRIAVPDMRLVNAVQHQIGERDGINGVVFLASVKRPAF